MALTNGIFFFKKLKSAQERGDYVFSDRNYPITY
jgi:hypothetical protein